VGADASSHQQGEIRMSKVSEFTEPAIELLEIATIIGRYGTLIALVIGIIGWWGYAKSPRAMARFRGMAVGGGAGYIAIVAIDVIYEVLVFILGSKFLPDGWPYGAVTGVHEKQPLPSSPPLSVSSSTALASSCSSSV